MGTDRADLAPQLEAFTDQARQLVENLRQIPTRPFLKQHSGHEKLYVHQWQADAQFCKCHVDRKPEVLLLGSAAELTAQRVSEFLMHHFERHRKCMAGSHRTGNKL